MMRPVRHFACLVAMVLAAAVAASAQGARDDSRRASGSALERQVRAAAAWDANNDQIFTCAEWKAYVGGLFTKADRNRDGYLDASEFPAIQAADAQFKNAEIGYFDDNRDGRVSRAEFVDKPNPFFLQFDKDRDCRVTLDEIAEAVRAAVTPGPRRGEERPR